MMPIFLSIVLVLFSSTIVTAQTMVLRSGEHDGFTRLVANLPQDVKWNLDIEGATLQLRFNETFPTIDISSVFQRISRNRISQIQKRSDNLGIDIFLACDCGFQAILEENSLLVIDISETLRNRSSQGDENIFDNASKPEIDDQRAVTLPLLNEGAQRNFFIAETILTQNNVAISNISTFQKNELNTMEAHDQDTRDPEVFYLNRKALLAQISSATSEGILKPSHSMEEVSSAIQGNFPKWQDHPNLRTISTSELVSQDEILDSLKQKTCIPKEEFDVSNWGHTDGFATGLSMWRNLLMEEFDKVDGVAALGLARHYIHYGFGQEAQAILDLLSYSDSQIDHLRRMARIVDLGHDPVTDDNSWMMECGKEELLWSVLSLERVSSLTEPDSSAVRLAFEGLPPTLKQHLGPSLAKKLAESGDSVGADGILTSVGRDGSNPSPAFDYAQASQILRAGDTQTATKPLSNVLKTNSEYSPLALIALIDTAVAENQHVDDSTVNLVASYLFENRQTDLSEDLSRAHILALAFSGRFTEAFDNLTLFEDATNTLDSFDTRSQVMERLLDHADDIKFLAAVMNRQLTGLSSAIENRFAQRLLDLGFPETALEIMAETAEDEDDRTRRLLRARAAMLMNEPEVAEAELMGLSGEEVFSLRAAARRLRGDFGANTNNYPETYTEQQLEDLDWLAGNRPLIDPGNNQDALMPLDPDGISTFDQSQELDSPTSGMISNAESLIQDSNETRIALQEVLSRFQLDVESNQ